MLFVAFDSNDVSLFGSFSSSIDQFLVIVLTLFSFFKASLGPDLAPKNENQVLGIGKNYMNENKFHLS